MSRIIHFLIAAFLNCSNIFSIPNRRNSSFTFTPKAIKRAEKMPLDHHMLVTGKKKKKSQEILEFLLLKNCQIFHDTFFLWNAEQILHGWWKKKCFYLFLFSILTFYALEVFLFSLVVWSKAANAWNCFANILDWFGRKLEKKNVYSAILKMSFSFL